MSKNVKIATILLASMAMAGGAYASTASATFDGAVEGSCTVAAGAPGALTLTDSNIATQSQAVVSVSTNADGAYKVGVAAPTAFTSKPAGYSGDIGNATATFELTGANSSGQIGNGQEYNLDAAGNNIMNVSVQGATNSPMEAGNYVVESVVSCVAQ